MKNTLYVFGAILLIFSLLAFVNDGRLLFTQPSNFPQPTYRFNENPLTPGGVELGRMLFYDAQLSRDGTISCGSCHQQPAGFTQHGHALSHGIDDQLTQHNSMPLQNLAWKSTFGWDGGIHDLDFFAVSPIQKANEMGETLPNVLEKLRKDKSYPKQFEKAFGSTEINTERFLKALSQFMLTLVSANSRYDKFIRNEGEKLTETELAGMTVFKQKCASCHAGELFSDQNFRNNGLIIKDLEDIGRMAITLKDEDKYKFLVPSLRNVALTFPYMHDGRFSTLIDVLNHYEKGIQANKFTDPMLKNGIQLSTDEKTQIIAFLNTLTDTQFLQNLKFSETYDAFAEPTVNIGDWTKVDFGDAPIPVKDSLNKALYAYFGIKNALIDENKENVIAAASQFMKIMSGINKSQMTAIQKSFFNQTYKDLFFDIKDVSSSRFETIEHQREHFVDVSNNFYKLLKAFKANKKVIFYLFCENANRNRGAYWLSETNKTINPYFSKNNANLCGKIIYDVVWGNPVK